MLQFKDQLTQVYGGGNINFLLLRKLSFTWYNFYDVIPFYPSSP